MTGRSASLESCAASVGDSDPKAGSIVPLAAPAVIATTAAGSRRHGGGGGGQGRTDKNLRFDMVPRPKTAALLGRGPSDATGIP